MPKVTKTVLLIVIHAISINEIKSSEIQYNFRKWLLHGTYFSVTRTVTRVLVVHRHHVFLLCNSSHATHNATRSCLISRADFISAWTRFCSASRVALPIGALRSSLIDPAETYSYSPWEIAGTKQNETSLGFSSERFWRVCARCEAETRNRRSIHRCLV